MEKVSMLDEFLLSYPYDKLSFDSNLASGFGEITTNLLHGDFQINISETICQEFLSSSLTSGSLEENLILRCQDILKEENKEGFKKFDALCLGISSLQLFVQLNWTGPLGPYKNETPLGFLRKNLPVSKTLSESEFKDKVTNELVLDGEVISPNFHHLELLLVARALLFADNFQEGMASVDWWRIRCLFVHQQVLEERSPILYSQLSDLVEKMRNYENVEGSPAYFTQMRLEATRIWLYYGYVNKAFLAHKEILKERCLEISLEGALGKRTRFQGKEVAQLVLSLVFHDGIPVYFGESNALEEGLLPKNVKLEDDVRLDHVVFSDPNLNNVSDGSASDQAIVLGASMYHLKNQAKDKLQTEEVMPYLSFIIKQESKGWATFMTALLQRSKLESEHKRTVERSLKQFEVLTHAVTAEEPSAEKRLAWFYCSFLPPAWKVEALLAKTCVSLGLLKTALDIFLKLQLWADVIDCYNVMGLRHKAAEIIRQELEKKPTVMLLCLLGDATDDIACYKQAWELSNEKSAKAQRHWGMYYFTHKRYAESIPHLEKSLELNSLHDQSLWFRLGYAALAVQNWTLCATAYRRYCTLDPESFEAWNNLAKAYVKLGQKDRAFRALQEAVKCNYENWKVWDNLKNVSADLGQYEEVIKSYNRILDLEEKILDFDILMILKNVIENNLPSECPIWKLRELTLMLFGRLTNVFRNSSVLWKLYAQVAATGEATPDSESTVKQCLHQAYVKATDVNFWYRDITICPQVLDLCIELAKVYQKCSLRFSTYKKKFELLHSAKLKIKPVLTLIEKEHKDLITGELPETITSKYNELLSLYEQIVTEIEMERPQLTGS